MAAYDLIAVYMMASKANGTLYTGVTSDLLRRAMEHRDGSFSGFAKRGSVLAPLRLFALELGRTLLRKRRHAFDEIAGASGFALSDALGGELGVKTRIK